MGVARNKKWIVRLGGLWLALATAHASVDLGIDVLSSQDYSLLKGKRVGLITNQTGLNSAGTKQPCFTMSSVKERPLLVFAKPRK